MGWWDIGEGSGHRSQKGTLRMDLVDCGFCGESGKFSFAVRQQKKNSAGKVLNYDILNCEQCGNLTSVFWGIGSSGLQGIHQVPWLTQTRSWPKHWPEDVGRYWLQAKRNVESSNWDAAALMARSAVQLTLRHMNAEGKTLFKEINNLGEKALLPPVMIEWAHEIRLLGNENAHPQPGGAGTSAADAKAIVEYLSMLIRIVFDLPHQIDQHRVGKS